ncbi:MAG: OmpA family protein [Paracoccaceae bacterium]
MRQVYVNVRAAARLFITVIVMLSMANGITLAAGNDDAGQGGGRVVKGEKYVPAIWVDPDGCEHWVMDDGWEGYMTPHVTRDGRPVCRTGNTCAVLGSDQLFATDRFNISAANRARLENFFRQVDAKSFIIAGHTDSRASDAYNMTLSRRRASAVARIATAVGADVFNVFGYGERLPKASNRTAAGRAMNRRVEVICMH